MTSSSSIVPDAATGTTIRRGSSVRRWESSSGFAARPFRRRGSALPEDCLFCRLYAEGEHVATTDGFVAVRDINPRADVHLLVIPERHVPSFREVSEFPPDEAKRMLDFIAETARAAGLEDYRVVVNVGEGGGQTIFHLHWHILGGRLKGIPG
jgi:histidine triad (HIT) family protein